MNVIKALFDSKKFIVFLTGTITSALVLFADMPEEQAGALADRVMYLTGMYLVGQGASDLGKGIGARKEDKKDA